MREKKRRDAETEGKRLRDEFEDGGCKTQTWLWNIARKIMLKDRGALPNEQVIESENTRPGTRKHFSADDTEGKAAGVEEVMRKRTKEEESKIGKKGV